MNVFHWSTTAAFQPGVGKSAAWMEELLSQDLCVLTKDEKHEWACLNENAL